MCSTIFWIVDRSYLYTLWVPISFLCLVGQFSIFPTACVTYFGLKAGPKVYAILFTAIGTSSYSGFLISTYLLNHLGYIFIFILSSIFTAFSLVLFNYFVEPELQKLHTDTFKDESKPELLKNEFFDG